MMSGKNGSKVRPPMMSLALVRSWTAGKNSADRQVSSKPLAMAGCQTARALGWALSRAFMPAVIAPCTCRRRAAMCGTVPTVAIIDGVRSSSTSMSIRRPIFTPAMRSSSRKWISSPMRSSKAACHCRSCRVSQSGQLLGASSCWRRGTRAWPAGTLGESGD